MQVCFLLLLIQLHITEGCKLEENESQRNITVYTGGSVLLSCSCTDHHTKPTTFEWYKYTNSWVAISLESHQYKHRFELVNDHTSGNHSLLISHLTEEDDGLYWCSGKEVLGRDFKVTVIDITTAEPTLGIGDKTAEKAPENFIIVIIIIITIFLSSSVVVLLLLILLGRVKSWQSRGQREVSNGQTVQRRQQKMQNDVTYSTVVHSNPVRAAHTPVISGDTALYASIKTS